MCVLRLFPHMIFSRHITAAPATPAYELPQDLNHFFFPDREPFLAAIVSEDEQPMTIKGVDHYFCCKEG